MKQNPTQKAVIRSAMMFVVLIGTVSLFSDATYEGGRSIVGQFMQTLGSSAFAVGVAVGAGEFLGYALRLLSGLAADRTGAYWRITLIGYTINLFAMPALAFVGKWQIAIVFLFAERIGKAIRNPSRDAMLSFATTEMGRGWGYGLHEAMDQIGAFLGPLLMALVLWIRGGDSGTENLRVSDYQGAFIFLLIPAIIAMGILFAARYLFPRPRDLESKTPHVGTHGFTRSYWLFTIAAGLTAAGIADFALIAYHFEQVDLISEPLIPIFFAIGMAVDALAALVLGRVYDRRARTAVIIAVGLGAAFAPFVYFGTAWVALIGMGLWGIAVSAGESVLKAGVADVVSPNRRAWGFGMFATVFGVGWFAGSALMGLLYDIRPGLLVWFSVAIQAVSLPVFLMAFRARSHERATAAG